MAIVTASIKGQVVIPKKEREKLGIKPGSKLVVKTEGDHIEIYPLPENPAASYCGVFETGTSLTKALLKERKEERRREEEKGARLLRPARLSKKGKQL